LHLVIGLVGWFMVACLVQEGLAQIREEQALYRDPGRG
jgi:hypothetical protein